MFPRPNPMTVSAQVPAVSDSSGLTDERVGTSSGGSYTVQSGDSLSKIGEKFGVSWQKIFDANRDKLDDPDTIHPGQELTIPSEQ